MDKLKVERLKNIVFIILRILRWPAVIVLLPVVVYLIFVGVLKTEQLIYNNAFLIVGAVIFVTYTGSVISSTFFTEYFLVSTGIASGLFLISSLFISNPNWTNESFEFDTMKMTAIAILIFTVLLGDLTVLCVRKIRRRAKIKKSK